jgi:hypothetical protein
MMTARAANQGHCAVIQPSPPDEQPPADNSSSQLLLLYEHAAAIRVRLARLVRKLALRLGEAATGDEPAPEKDNPDDAPP